MTLPKADQLQQALFDLSLPPLPLEGGGVVSGHRLRGWIWSLRDDVARLEAIGAGRPTPPRGPLSPVRRAWGSTETPHVLTTPVLTDDRPTVLLVHALTGDMRAGGEGGWWEPLVGVGRPLDPRRFRLLCFNNLGGCYGSSGPGDADYPRDDSGRPRPVTTWDQARSLWLALEALGVARLHTVAGGSLGGMIALALAALEPERVERLVPIAACEAASAWIIGWNHVARQILSLDSGPRGLELARQLAMMTYRAEGGLHQRQGRGQLDSDRWQPDGRYRIGSYLEHQGARLRDRFDAESYALQLGAMDHHDLGRRPDVHVSNGTTDATLRIDPNNNTYDDVTCVDRAMSADWGLRRLRSSTLAVQIDTDALYLPAQSTRLVERLRALGRRAELATLHSPHGHDAFLIEWPQLTALLARGLALPAGGQETDP